MVISNLSQAKRALLKRHICRRHKFTLISKVTFLIKPATISVKRMARLKLSNRWRPIESTVKTIICFRWPVGTSVKFHPPRINTQLLTNLCWCRFFDTLPIDNRSVLTHSKWSITIHPAHTTFIALRLVDGSATTHSNGIGRFQRST